MLDTFRHKQIDFQYPTLRPEIITHLRNSAMTVEIQPTPSTVVHNAYYKANLPGSQAKVYTREAIMQRLHALINFLSPHYGLFIFDAFRTKQTQEHLFKQIYNIVQQKHPEMDEHALYQETCKYVAPADAPEIIAIPSHNSGGAIDLALFDLASGELLDFGTEIDDPVTASNTAYFEQDYPSNADMSEHRWLQIRHNRRLLYHTMVQFDFTNLDTEWWHYDLGDCLWAQAHGVDCIFESMESLL